MASKFFFFFLLSIAFITLSSSAPPISLLNVSYDPTREFYEEYNRLFIEMWKKKTGQEVTINMSHGGSGKQARAVLEGLNADVVTLALAYDIDMLARKGFIDKEWEKRLPYHSSPHTSIIVFLVRKGNPKNIHDWNDLIRPGIKVITPNPKTSGGARWNWLAAWAYAMNDTKGNKIESLAYMKKLFANVPVLDTGARGATLTFARRHLGDVLLAWENEAYQAMKALGEDQFDIVLPSISILAELPVSIVDRVVNKRETKEVASEYLAYLYSQEAQKLAAEHYFRPRDATVAKKFPFTQKTPRLITIEELGGWSNVQKEHFNDNGLFDEIYLKESH